MASIPANFGLVQNVAPIRHTPPPVAKKEIAESTLPSQDNLVSINFSAQAPSSGPAELPKAQTVVVPQETVAPTVAKPTPAPAGTAYGAGGTLMMMDSPTPAKESHSSLDGFLAKLAGGSGSADQAPKQSAFGRGVESSGTVLKRVVVDAADFGNKVGKMLGCDETAPGLKGFIGTNISVTAALIGGLAATPLALIVGVADAIS